MGTITITAAGFANTPSTQPAGWPAGITYPASVTANGTRTITVSDADWISLITWAASLYFVANAQTPPAPTAQQILLAWINGQMVNATKNAVQQYFTQPAVVPAVITMT